MTFEERLEVLAARFSGLSELELQTLSRLAFDEMVNDATRLLMEDHSASALSVVVPGMAALQGPIEISHLSTRARNCLQKHRIVEWHELGALSAASFHAMRGVGLLTTIEVLERLVLSVVSVNALASVASPQNDEVSEARPPGFSPVLANAFQLLGSWHYAVFGAQKAIPDVIERARAEADDLPGDAEEALRIINEFEISGAVPVVAAKDVKRELGDRLWKVFRSRCLSGVLGSPRTLQEIGEQLGVGRERVRQLETMAAERLRAAVARPDFASLRWRSAHIGAQLGAGVPLASELAKQALGNRTKTELLAVWCAGPYIVDKSWLRRHDARPANDLETAIRSIDRATLSTADLEAAAMVAGVPAAVAIEAAEIVVPLRRVGDAWVMWDGTLTDKARLVLELLGRPATLDEVLAHLGHAMSQRNLSNRMLSDARFCRVTKQNWALREWGLDAYSGIAEEIAKRIEAQGGVADRSAVVADITSRFDVSANSVNIYASTPRFVTEGQQIRLREPHEDVPLPDRPSYSNVMTPESGRVLWRIVVDSDWRRGSGRNVGAGLAIALGSRPGRNVQYTTPHQVIEVFWQLSAIGPHVGSLRSLVESLSAADGESIVISFDTHGNRATAEVVDPSLRGVDLLRKVAGIRGDSPWPELAAALDVDTRGVEDALVRRQFGDLIPHLPPGPGRHGGRVGQASDAASLVADLTGDLRPF